MSSLNYMELCRLCLVKDRVQIPIFEGEGDIRQIFLKIAACLPVKVKKDDKLPKKICDDCMYKVEMLYQFWNTTANAEKQLLEWLGEAVEEKKTNNDTHVKQESMEQDPGSELAKSLSRVEAVLAEAREAESDNDNFAGSNKAETDSDDEPLSSLEPTTFVNVGLNGSGTNESNTQGEFLAPGAPSTSKTNSTNAQMAASGYLCNSFKIYLKMPKIEPDDELSKNPYHNSNKNKRRKKGSSKKKGSKHHRKLTPLKCEVPHEPIEEVDVKPLTCSYENCISIFQTENDLKKHLKSHKKSFKCSTCQKEFTSKKLLNRHVAIHSDARPFTCEICLKSYKTKNELQSHKKRHNNVERNLKCEYCDYTTAYRSAMDTHSRRHTQEFPYNCTVCNKGFLVKTWFLEHINFHTGDKPFQCDLCGKAFPYTRYLTAHKRHSHPKHGVQLILKCETCGRIFSHKRTYRNHMKSHTGENVHLCDICGKALSSQEHLKFHRRIHTGEKPNVCDVCGKGFAKKCNLILHRRVHTGERPYICDICSKAFTQRSTLVIHKRYHTGQRPYVCVFCSKGFVCKALLNSHQKTHCPPA